ncbi:hypothetical protein D3C75_1092660 [compost metagenome]
MDVTGSTFFSVEEAGEYRIFVQLMSKEFDLAQSACNVTLNDQALVTIQTNGTQGNWIRQKLVKVHFEAGVYEMKFDFTKPGLQIDWIEFKSL